MRYRIVEVGDREAYEVEVYAADANGDGYWKLIKVLTTLTQAESHIKSLLPKERKVIKEINTESRGQHD